MMTIPDTLIFDYGGVLEGPLDEAAFQNDLATLATRYGFPDGKALWHHIYISSAWEDAKRGKISREDFWVDRLSTLGLCDKDEQNKFQHSLFQSRGIRPTMRSLLEEVKQVCRLAVLSNTAQRDFALYLEERDGFDGLFDVVISSAEVGMAKPNPRIYLLTLERLHLQPSQVLFIDDLVRNTKAAEKLGIASIQFTNPAQLQAELIMRGILS